MATRSLNKLGLRRQAVDSLLGRCRGLQGIDRRTFLVGAATAVVAHGPVGRVAAAVMTRPPKLRRGTDGRIESVTVSGSGGTRWTVDSRLYDGAPVLTFSEHEGGSTLSLTGALLPGTAFRIGLEARISTTLLGRTLSLTFTETGVTPVGFSMAVDLDDWLQGRSEAEASLDAAAMDRLLSASALAPRARIQTRGAGSVCYLPDGSFRVTVPAQFTAAGETFAISCINLCACGSSDQAIASGTKGPFTLLRAVTDASTDHALKFTTAGGWKVEGRRTGPAELTAELNRRGACALVVAGGASEFCADAHGVVQLGLSDTRSVHIASDAGSTRGVVGRFADEGTLVDLSGCAVELAPHGDHDRFVAMEGDEGSYEDVELTARRTSLGIGDAVVTTHGAVPTAIALIVAPQDRRKPIVPPKDHIVILPQKNIGLITLPAKVDVVRREDMLALSFEFVNMRLDTDASHIVRSDATKPSYMIVTFPPQSVAEKAYFEDETGGPQPGDLPPVPARVAGPSRLVFFVPGAVQYIHFSLKGEDGKGAGGLLDWQRLTPSVVRTAFSHFGPNGPIRLDPSFVNPADRAVFPAGVLRRPSRVLPAGGILKLGALISGALTPKREVQPAKDDASQMSAQGGSIEEKLIPVGRDVNPALIADVVPQARIPVVANPLYTAIEMPVRLILSPNEAQGWAHTANVVQSPATQRVELWHTRLARRTDKGLVEDVKLAIRAVDAVDYDKQMGELIGSGQYDQAMTRENRCDLVNNMVYRAERGDTLPFWADRLMLTPLGGYLKGSGNWDVVYIPEKKLSHLMSWTHSSTLGRDHYVKIVTRGYLFPTGHPAARVVVSERKIVITGNGPVAYLRQRVFVQVRQATMSFTEAEQRELGFKSITILTKETPPLSQDTDAPDAPVNVFWTLLSTGAFPFSVQAEDVEGRMVRWGMPMIYVDQGDAQNMSFIRDKLIPYYAPPADVDDPKRPRRHQVFGQKVAFAPAEDASESTAYPVDEIFLTATAIEASNMVDKAAFRCILKNAKVRIAAADYLAGASAPPAIEVEIPAIYKTAGFAATNTAKMFLKLTDAMPKEGVPLKFGDASKSGGLVNPDSMVTAFSRGRGPIGGSLDDIQAGVSSVKDLLPDTGKLLGAVSLWQLLPDKIPITPGDPNDPNTLKSPRLEVKIEKDADKKPIKANVQFSWKPEIGSWPSSDPILKINQPWSTSYAPLELTGNVVADLVKPADSSYEFVGILRNFDLDCIAPASFIQLHFDELKFSSKTGEGSSVSITPEFPKTKFVGPLTFVQKFEDLLDKISGSSEIVASTEPGLSKFQGVEFTPFMDVTPQGIQTGFHLGVPALGFGVFSIENIALSAELDLPLLGSAMSVRFAFCERSSPFRLSVMGFAGGGFLGIVIDPSGVQLLEAALEFGGSLSLDIGVASGGVSVMAGIYFKMDSKKALLEGYVRLDGCLSVIGLIHVSLEFYLSLSYDTGSGCASGTATLTVEVEVLFFSASVSMTVQKQFAGSPSSSAMLTAGDAAPGAAESAPFTKAMSEGDWKDRYCAAFA